MNNRQVVVAGNLRQVAGNLRHIGAVVEEPCIVAVGSQPFYYNYSNKLIFPYKAHQKKDEGKMTKYHQWISSLLNELNIDADVYASYVIGILEDAGGQDDGEIEESIAEILSSALVRQ